MKRKYIKAGTKKLILFIQDNKCLYCKRPLGDYYVKNGEQFYRRTTAEFDHLNPFIICGNDLANIVAACNLCNGIKHAKIFNTLIETMKHIQNKLKESVKFLYQHDLPSNSEHIRTIKERFKQIKQLSVK
jgi:uncharacterized protein with NRDE domain